MTGQSKSPVNELESVYAALAQAQDCIRGETPEDLTDAEAREDTINKVRGAMRIVEAMQSADPEAWMREDGSAATINPMIAAGWKVQGGQAIPLYTIPRSLGVARAASEPTEAYLNGYAIGLHDGGVAQQPAPDSPVNADLIPALERNADDCENMERWATPELAPLLREAAKALRSVNAQRVQPTRDDIARLIAENIDIEVLGDGVANIIGTADAADAILSSVISTPSEPAQLMPLKSLLAEWRGDVCRHMAAAEDSEKVDDGHEYDLNCEAARVYKRCIAQLGNALALLSALMVSIPSELAPYVDPDLNKAANRKYWEGRALRDATGSALSSTDRPTVEQINRAMVETSEFASTERRVSQEAMDWAASQAPMIEAYKADNPDAEKDFKSARDVIGGALSSNERNEL